jgi:hypothetical protein
MNIGTPYGLALASGIDAYIPLLSYAACARFLHLFKVNPNLAFITQDWFMIMLVILALADLFADKIPVVDHVWDAIHTVLRPAAGAIVAAAASNQTSGTALLLPIIFGGTLAGMAHTTKAATRLTSTATSAGIANVGISIAEDVVVVIATLLSLFAPIVMIVVVVLFVIVFLAVVPRLLRMLGRGLRKLRARSSRRYTC